MSAGPFQYPIHYGTTIDGAGEDLTASVVNGSVTVSIAFAGLLSALQPGDIFLCGGSIGLVKAIPNNETITLATPWAGATLANAPFVFQRWLQHTDGRWIGYNVTEYFAKIQQIPAEIEGILSSAQGIRDQIEADRSEVAAKAGAVETARGEVEGNAVLVFDWRNEAEDFKDAAANSAGTATAGASTATTQAGLATAEADRAASYVPNMVGAGIAGLRLAPNGANPGTRIDIAAGVARDTTHTANLILPSGITKRLDAGWAVGSGNGGLDTGARQAGATYHIFLIRNPTTQAVDALFSLSPSNPVLPSGYTQKRRLGSIINGGANTIIPFHQTGDYFAWKQYTDTWLINGSPNNALALRDLLVPTGIKVRARFKFLGAPSTGTAGGWMLFRDPDVEVPAASQAMCSYYRNGVGGLMGMETECWTNALGQIYTYDSDAAALLYLAPIGFWDFRDEYL